MASSSQCSAAGDSSSASHCSVAGDSSSSSQCSVSGDSWRPGGAHASLASGLMATEDGACFVLRAAAGYTTTYPPPCGELQVLHDDERMVVVEKPAFLPTENTLRIKDSVRARLEVQFEDIIRAATELHQKYKLFEQHMLRNCATYKRKLPEIERTLQLVKHLKERRDNCKSLYKQVAVEHQWHRRRQQRARRRSHAAAKRSIDDAPNKRSFAPNTHANTH